MFRFSATYSSPPKICNAKCYTERLNGGVFRGRSIIASDKNKSEAIKIKELVDIELKALREQVRAASAPMTQPASPTLYGSPVSVTMTPQTSEGGGMQVSLSQITFLHAPY
jgi:hypothetical protein